MTGRVRVYEATVALRGPGGGVHRDEHLSVRWDAAERGIGRGPRGWWLDCADVVWRPGAPGRRAALAWLADEVGRRPGALVHCTGYRDQCAADPPGEGALLTYLAVYGQGPPMTVNMHVSTAMSSTPGTTGPDGEALPSLAGSLLHALVTARIPLSGQLDVRCLGAVHEGSGVCRVSGGTVSSLIRVVSRAVSGAPTSA